MKLLGMMPIALLTVVLSTNWHAISSCNGACRTLNDCPGQLICIDGMCSDDPDLGTQTCGTGGGGRSVPMLDDGGCQPSGSLLCNGVSHPTFTCSPPVISLTPATLTHNDFSQGGDGGDPSECDEQYHNNSELIVVLLTGWFDNGSHCEKIISIKSIMTGRSVVAIVVDECDSMYGCNVSHTYQPPCPNNVVNGSDEVWSNLGLDMNVGEEDVTWSMLNGALQHIKLRTFNSYLRLS